jgi:hypothetical protein
MFIYYIYIYINGKELKKVNACKNRMNMLVISLDGIGKRIKEGR